MYLRPFEKTDNNPAYYEDNSYTTHRDRHITKILQYLIDRTEELLLESNNKDATINILGAQVSHLTDQMNCLAKLAGDAAEKKDFESLTAIQSWLEDRKNNAKNSTSTVIR